MTNKDTKPDFTVIFTLNPVKQIPNEVYFDKVCDFMDWFFINKKSLKDKKIYFKSELENIDVQDINNMYEFLKFYIQTKKECDLGMKAYNEKLLSQDDNEEIQRAISEFIRMNDSGKFIRASLVGLGYRSTDNQDDKYLSLAVALEVFQTSILIHDDIIDKATIRRGKDTIPVSYNKAYNNETQSELFVNKKQQFADSMGICIGDLGFYLANQIIVDGYRDCSNLADILSYYHNTAIQTCKGEMIDVILPFKEEFFETDKNLENKIMDVYKLKTAWYSVIGPYCLGLILGKSKKEHIEKMEKILLNIGVAFQIKDDLLGIYGDEKRIGKSTNSDIEEYKQTILYSYVMKTEYKEELLKYYGKENLKEKEIDRVKEILEMSGAKKHASEVMNELFESSVKDLEEIDFLTQYSKDILNGFVVYLQNRSK